MSAHAAVHDYNTIHQRLHFPADEFVSSMSSMTWTNRCSPKPRPLSRWLDTWDSPTTFCPVAITRLALTQGDLDEPWMRTFTVHRSRVKACDDMLFRLGLHSSSPTSSYPLVRHLPNGQTVPLLPSPVQMTSVISVSHSEKLQPSGHTHRHTH